MDNFVEQIIALVGNVGFPIAVSVYLLVRIEEKLENLTLSIYDLAKAVNSVDKNGNM